MEQRLFGNGEGAVWELGRGCLGIGKRQYGGERISAE